MYFDDLKVGMSADLDPVTIDKDKMIAFAKEYDNIPLHTDEEYAKTTPFKGLIAPGVMSFMAVWASYLKVDYFGEELLAGKSTKMELFKPVYPGDVLTGKASITNLVKRNERNGLTELTIDIYNQNGDLVLKDVKESVVKCRP
jgi:acyl dehydratase